MMPSKFSLLTTGWRSQLAVVFSLMTILPLLTFGYFLSAYLMPQEVTRENLVLVIVLNLILSFAGFFMLWRILRSLSRFRVYVEDIAQGDLSGKISDADGTELDSIARSLGIIVQKLQDDRLRFKDLSMELEKKVEERTFELGRSNESLRRELEDRKKAESALEASRKQLMALAARLESVREKERTHIAREIHDELGHMLTAMKIDLAWLGNKISDADDKGTRIKFAEKLKSSTNQLDQMIQTVRRIATQLRPELLDHLGLGAAIEWESSEFSKRTGITCSLKMENECESLSRDQSTGLFRIFQEILTNIARHAKASKVTIKLEEQGGCYVMDVKDNGVGIQDERIMDPQSLGVLGMRERARILGAEFDIMGRENDGTEVVVKIPV